MTDVPTERPEADALREPGPARERRLAALFERHRPRLARMVKARMDPLLRARVGASDVVQETWLEVRDRVGSWVADPSMPFYLWVRFLAVQRLLKLRRFHVGAKRRDARRQAGGGAGPEVTTPSLVSGLAASGVTPSGVAAAGEMRARLSAALEALDAPDREVLALRHFEELSNAEAAAVLRLRPDATSKRYLRALARLRAAMERGGPGGGA